MSTENEQSPPLPLDDSSHTDPLWCPPLTWGLIGCGRVSHDFTQALKHIPTATVIACSARSEASAKEFAKKHCIEKHYGSYDALISDPEVEIVYIGNIHCFRRSVVEKCLLANKHALVEKPFTCNAEDAEYLIALAKERNLFLMEGMWTRFFPAVQKARDLVLKEGVIGDVVQVQTDFNFNAGDSEEYPESFLYNHDLGGGASLLVAPYPIAAATLFFEGRMPDVVKVSGQVDPNTGVDLQVGMVMTFHGKVTDGEEKKPMLPKSGMALLTCGIVCESEEETTVIGTKGRLTICSPGHCPTKIKVTYKQEGRSNVTTQILEYPLPEETTQITREIAKTGGYNYPNSAGFAYEAAAVARCIDKGLTQVPQYTLEETLVNMKLVDEIRKQLGVKPVQNMSV